MKLFVCTLTVVFAVVALVSEAGRNEQRALACSVIPTTLEDHVPSADFIGIVEVVRVGDDQNRAPTLTPSPTLAPPETPTVEGAELTPTAAATGESYLDFSTPTHTSTSTATAVRPAYALADLSGRGADLVVVEELVGRGAPEFSIDWDARAGLERRLREAESGRVSSCGVGGLPAYRVGERYFLVARAYESPGLTTVSSYRISGNDAIFGDYSVDGTYSSNAFRASTYFRYLSDFEADVQTTYDDKRFAYVEIDRLPLDRMRTVFLSMYRREFSDDDGVIAPPETGNAGLKPSR